VIIGYIHYRCMAWSAQGQRDKDGGTGYPRQSIYCRAYDPGHVWDESNPHAIPLLIEVEWWEMESAIQSLPDHLRAVVRVMYLQHDTVTAKAKQLHICRGTLFNRLGAAHAQIMDYLLDHSTKTPKQAKEPVVWRLQSSEHKMTT